MLVQHQPNQTYMKMKNIILHCKTAWSCWLTPGILVPVLKRIEPIRQYSWWSGLGNWSLWFWGGCKLIISRLFVYWPENTVDRKNSCYTKSNAVPTSHWATSNKRAWFYSRVSCYAMMCKESARTSSKSGRTRKTFWDRTFHETSFNKWYKILTKRRNSIPSITTCERLISLRDGICR